MVCAGFHSLRIDTCIDIYGVGLYIAYNGSQDAATSSVTVTAQSQHAIHFLIHSSNQSASAPLANDLPAGPYLLDLSSGDIHEGDCRVRIVD